ncbi:cation:proton antiporter [Clostridium sp. NSJ-49]|uniref:Putative Na(+)/H(+) antiporterprotein n=1 Tax=Clostridium disporicum TaxID=84024 RepID=A0A174BJC6_9CLOT|nr:MULTISPECIES: cation:proton antiporter [Clostridium]MBC5624302.1 cation:proton antiporter [Clostridium sp. NSJ-49]MCD2500795.1 cation:proton antiporter [Clostridium sp. NSJ-145]MDU6340199.1 cation:proton antiporter [Clostridium sp.]CUO01102.1 putative Na(+)/H(+) antiporterprotein [Clostridium disporicum]
MSWFYYLAIILIFGLLMGKVVSYLKLPRVTGYLIAGVLIGPFVLKLVPHEAIESLTIISEAALGFIAYNIGSSLNYNKLKNIGKGVIIIALFEALMATFVVTLAMKFIFGQTWEFSLAIGAIASATAPAATIMVLKQYKAKGPLVDTLIPVVAIDDAIAVIAFGISIAIAQIISKGSDGVSIMAFLNPFIEIFFSIVLGCAVGFALTYFNKLSKQKENAMNLVIAAIFLVIGLADLLDLSNLLACMALGATVSNLVLSKSKLLSSIDNITSPIFIMFFTISGLELDLSVLLTVGLIGIGYVVFRVIGKVLGAYIGAQLANSQPVVKKYLGLTLVPQAGVAIGLTMIVQEALPSCGASIRAIILAGTVIYELIGPLCTKIAIFKAGEATVDAHHKIEISH